MADVAGGNSTAQQVRHAREGLKDFLEVVCHSGNRRGRCRDVARCGETSFHLIAGDVNVG